MPQASGRALGNFLLRDRSLNEEDRDRKRNAREKSY